MLSVSIIKLEREIKKNFNIGLSGWYPIPSSIHLHISFSTSVFIMIELATVHNFAGYNYQNILLLSFEFIANFETSLRILACIKIVWLQLAT